MFGQVSFLFRSRFVFVLSREMKKTFLPIDNQLFTLFFIE